MGIENQEGIADSTNRAKKVLLITAGIVVSCISLCGVPVTVQQINLQRVKQAVQQAPKTDVVHTTRGLLADQHMDEHSNIFPPADIAVIGGRAYVLCVNQDVIAYGQVVEPDPAEFTNSIDASLVCQRQQNLANRPWTEKVATGIDRTMGPFAASFWRELVTAAGRLIEKFQ